MLHREGKTRLRGSLHPDDASASATNAPLTTEHRATATNTADLRTATNDSQLRSSSALGAVMPNEPASQAPPAAPELGASAFPAEREKRPGRKPRSYVTLLGAGDAGRAKPEDVPEVASSSDFAHRRSYGSLHPYQVQVTVMPQGRVSPASAEAPTERPLDAPLTTPNSASSVPPTTRGNQASLLVTSPADFEASVEQPPVRSPQSAHLTKTERAPDEASAGVLEASEASTPLVCPCGSAACPERPFRSGALATAALKKEKPVSKAFLKSLINRLTESAASRPHASSGKEALSSMRPGGTYGTLWQVGADELDEEQSPGVEESAVRALSEKLSRATASKSAWSRRGARTQGYAARPRTCKGPPDIPIRVAPRRRARQPAVALSPDEASTVLHCIFELRKREVARTAGKEQLCMAQPTQQGPEKQAGLVPARTCHNCRTFATKEQARTVRIEDFAEQGSVEDDGKKEGESVQLSSGTPAFSEEKRAEEHATCKLRKREIGLGAGKEQLTAQPTEKGLDQQADLLTARTRSRWLAPVTKQQRAIASNMEFIEQGRSERSGTQNSGSFKPSTRTMVSTGGKISGLKKTWEREIGGTDSEETCEMRGGDTASARGAPLSGKEYPRNDTAFRGPGHVSNECTPHRESSQAFAEKGRHCNTLLSQRYRAFRKPFNKRSCETVRPPPEEQFNGASKLKASEPRQGQAFAAALECFRSGIIAVGILVIIRFCFLPLLYNFP